MHTPIVFDGRNLFDPNVMRDLDFQYYSVGRPSTKANVITGFQTTLLASKLETVQGMPGDKLAAGSAKEVAKF
jgi:hypothetical protein